jgi:hypothetical protein
MSHFKNKYLKYKSKYLQLLNLKYNQIGGELPIINDIDSINLFTDPEMEKYMNPIHGFILCNKGTIPNNYWLYKDGLYITLMGKLIKKVCRDIPGNIQPTKELMKLKPIDFGRYIALKYINMMTNIMTGDKYKFIQINKSDKIVIDQQLIKEVKNREELIGFINKIRTYIPFLDNDIFNFHIILYCLWWNANNDNGIAEYYNGIKEIFDFLNKLPSIQLLCIKPLVLKDKCAPQIPNSFEKTVIKITHKEFKIYSQEQAQHFCTVNTDSTYADCGEITALNLINLLIISGSIFDISRLKSSSIPELLRFYRIFTNFNLISDVKFKQEIFGKNLNARDAWSYLIINYAKNNLEFVKKCTEPIYKFELNAGLNLDKSTSNFLQLIKNLLGIEKWEDLENDNIKNIKDDTKNGIGNITITHKTLGKFIIHCESGHYFIKQEEQRKVEEINLEKFTKDQITNINILLKKEDITLDNYLHIDINSEFLEFKFNSYSTDPSLKIKLFELSLTNKYDSDLRRRIQIKVDNDFFKNIVTNYGKKKNIDEYTYRCKNFDFILQLPAFAHLNFYIMEDSFKIECINLSSLSQLKFIGDKFLDDFTRLKSIDLSSLSQLESIGNKFIFSCSNLKSIILPTNSQLKSIGDNFMYYCIALTSIDLSSLLQLKSIGYNFMYECNALENIVFPLCLQLKSIGDNFMKNCKCLTSINLSFLSQLKSIGNNFMEGCVALESIVLPTNLQLESIGNYFLSGCKRLTNIDLFFLSQLKSIGDYFLSNCEALENIVLPTNLQLESIGNYFMSYCNRLTSINLSSLSQLKSIGDYFMYGCNALENIDFPLCLQLESIGTHFLNAYNLKSIILPSLSQLKSIGNSFMYGCSALTIIDLSSLSLLESIGNNFMYYCIALTSIDLSSLSQLKSIGDYFLSNCEALENIVLPTNLQLESIGNYFMSYCIALISIDLSSLLQLKSIGNNFMEGCVALENIVFPPCLQLKSIGDYFLSKCEALISIDLSSFSQIKSIGNNFMINSNSLTNVDFSSLSQLESIGFNFLYNYDYNYSKKEINIKCYYNHQKLIFNDKNSSYSRYIFNIIN